MDNQQTKLIQLIKLIDDFDTFKNLERDMSLFSVAIGTLRKDRSLALDITKITDGNSDGLGAMALSRVLIEDYFHLMFLNENQDGLIQQIENFNAHPTIQHYTSLQAMKEWGFSLDTQEDKDLITKVSAEFEKNKNKFLRSNPPKDPFNPDDYYRTWTKISLDKLIAKSGLTSTTTSKRSLKYLTEMYNTGSQIIHHDSFIIWLLASQDKSVLSNNYPGFALSISVITMSRIINLVFQISQPIINNDEQYAQLLNKLTDIM